MTTDDRLVRFDWAIKRILRHKADHSVLNGFLSSLLGEKITILKMLESEGNKDFEENKSNRVDMLAEDCQGRKILIEVQNETENSYFHRMLFGTSKIINDYLKKGQDYINVSKVYSVNIVYFPLGMGSDYVYHGTTQFRGLHDNDLLTLSPLFKEKFHINEVYEIFPEYYILKANDFNRLSRTPLDQWIYFLSHSRLPDNADAPGLQEAAQQLRLASLSAEERRDYEKYLDNMRSLEDVVESAWENGHYEGRAEGERLQALKTAEILLKENMPLELIAKATSLSIEEIKKEFGV